MQSNINAHDFYKLFVITLIYNWILTKQHFIIFIKYGKISTLVLKEYSIHGDKKTLSSWNS